MHVTTFKPIPALEHFVNSITVLEDNQARTLPFYADGYPGVVFKSSAGNSLLLPRKKILSDFFLYGQTIKPIEVVMPGAFKMIVFHLYPYASKILYGISPKTLNDDCFDLLSVEPELTRNYLNRIQNASSTKQQLTIISDYLKALARRANKVADLRLQRAINIMVNSKGTEPIKSIIAKLHTTERTFQRQFLNYVGVSPKQFSKIIQFQSSLNEVSQEALKKLTDIVYEGGYADQSHFIRDFKKYTGQSPKTLRNPK